MFKKLICLILIIKLAQAGVNFVPKSFGYDSAIIIDTDKSEPPNNNVFINYLNKIRPPAPYPVWWKYPSRDLLPPPLPGSNSAVDPWSNGKIDPVSTITPIYVTSTSATTTTTTPKPTISSITKISTTSSFLAGNEYPKVLLDIARTKLNLKNPDEIPSISELSQLLGTNTPEETLNHIKRLTSNEQGVALMRAYIESTDYTDNSENFENRNDDLKNKNDIGGIDESPKANYESLVDITDENSKNNYERGDEVDQVEGIALATTVMPPYAVVHPADFMKQMPVYVHFDNLINGKATEKKYKNMINVITRISGKKIKPIPWDSLEEQAKWAMIEYDSNNKLTSKSPVDDLTIKYPTPIRAQSWTSTSTTTTTTTPSPSSTTSLNSDNAPVVHLNTPKMAVPHVEHEERRKKIEDFLASKPKLLELATKVSPMGYGNNRSIEVQFIAALQKAIEQDGDLKKNFNSTDTLK